MAEFIGLVHLENPLLIIIFSLVCLNSCSFKKGTELPLRYANNTKEIKEKRHEEKLTFEETSRRFDLYKAITIEDVSRVKQYMEEGYDPKQKHR